MFFFVGGRRKLRKNHLGAGNALQEVCVRVCECSSGQYGLSLWFGRFEIAPVCVVCLLCLPRWLFGCAYVDVRKRKRDVSLRRLRGSRERYARCKHARVVLDCGSVRPR